MIIGDLVGLRYGFGRAFARRYISSGDTSSTRVASHQ